MKKTLQIMNHHDRTIERLQAFEQTIKNANMVKRVATIHLVMQGVHGLTSGSTFESSSTIGLFLCPEYTHHPTCVGRIISYVHDSV